LADFKNNSFTGTIQEIFNEAPIRDLITPQAYTTVRKLACTCTLGNYLTDRWMHQRPKHSMQQPTVMKEHVTCHWFWLQALMNIEPV